MSERADRSLQARALALFEEVCELSGKDRASLVDARCADDEALRAELERLLALDEGGAALPVTGLAAEAGRAARELAERGEKALKPEPPPEHVGGYRLLGVLGMGGMAVVHEAEQASPRRRVALKILRAGLVSEEERRRFLREAEVLARLRHPGIAQVIEGGCLEPRHAGDEAQPWFAMELVDGRPITEHADERGLDWKARCRLLARACEAVHHAHVKGVIHRDLKPANILVGRNGNPKVLDFGVARAVDELAGGFVQTRQGVLLGTLQYMSPEQARGDSAAADLRSDVYSLGLIAFELLAGRPARDLRDSSLVSATRQVLEAAVPRLSSVRPDLPRAAAAVVAMATSDDPESRHQSAAALADDLEALAAGEPVSATAPSAWEDLFRFARKRRDVIFVAVTAVTALALVAAYAVHQAWMTEAALEGEAEQRGAAERLLTQARGASAQARRDAERASLAAAQLALETGDVAVLQRVLEQARTPERAWSWRHLAARRDDARATWIEPGGDDSIAHLDLEGRLASWSTGSPLGTGWRRCVWELRGEARTWPLPLATEGGTLQVGRRHLPVALAAWVAVDGRELRVVDPEDEALLSSRRLCGEPSHVYELGPVLLEIHAGELWSCDPVSGATLGRRSLRGDERFGFSPSAPGLVLGSEDGTAEVVSLPGLHAVARLEGHHGAVRAGAVFPDGRRAVTGGRDGTLRWWSLPDGRELARLAPHGAEVTAAAVSPDGALVASAGSDGTVRIWDGGSQRLRVQLLGHLGAPTSLSFAADSSHLLSVGSDGARLWWLGDGGDPRSWEGHESYVYDLALSPDGRHLASASWDGRVLLREASGGRIERELAAALPTGREMPLAVAWSPDGRVLAASGKRIGSSGQWEAWLLAWEAETGRRLAALELGPGQPLDLGFTGDGRALLAGCGVRHVVVDTESWRPAGVVRDTALGARVLARRDFEHRIALCGPEWRPEGETARPDSEALLLDALLGPGFANAVSRSANGRRIAHAEDRAVVVRWTGSGELIARRELEGRSPFALAWGRDDEDLFLGTDDHRVRLLHSRDLEPVLDLRGHVSYVKSLVSHPGTGAIYSASGDGTVRLWDDRPLAELAPPLD